MKYHTGELETSAYGTCAKQSEDRVGINFGVGKFKYECVGEIVDIDIGTEYMKGKTWTQCQPG